MKPKFLKLCIIVLLVGFFVAGCHKNELPKTLKARGEIIIITSQCYGEAIVIEVDSPKGIGLAGSFAYIPDSNRIVYQNAIRVPYFSKIPEIPDIIYPYIGKYIEFEYREMKEEENKLFESTFGYPGCLWIVGAPTAKSLMITKILTH